MRSEVPLARDARAVNHAAATWQRSEGPFAGDDEAVNDARIALGGAVFIGGRGPVAAARLARGEPAGGVVGQVRRPPPAAAPAAAAPARILAPLARHLLATQTPQEL